MASRTGGKRVRTKARACILYEKGKKMLLNMDKVIRCFKSNNQVEVRLNG